MDSELIQSFVSGFTKQAAANGVNESAAVELLKSAEGLDIGALIAAHPYLSGAAALAGTGALGGMIGSNYAPQSNKELESEIQYSENPSVGKTLKHLLMPGLYTGYRAAKNNRLDHAYQKYLDDNRARQMQG